MKKDDWKLIDIEKIPSDFMVGPYKFKLEIEEGEFGEESVWEKNRYLILKGAEEGQSWYITRSEEKEKLYLTQKEFDCTIPLLEYWNSFKEKGYNVTVHKIPETIQDDVTGVVKITAQIITNIYESNFEELSAIFTIFQNKIITENYFKQIIFLYIQRYDKNRLNFNAFVYNPVSDFSWLCRIASENNIVQEDEVIELPHNSLLIYERLIGQKNPLTDVNKIALKQAVIGLYKEYEKIKENVGWFHRSVKSKYPFNNWDSFCKIHVNSLLDNYIEPNLFMIKPINKEGHFTKAYEKFIAFVGDKYLVSLYPNEKAFNVMLRNRYLIQFRDTPELFCEDSKYRFLYKSEFEDLKNRKIKLMDNIKTG